MAGTRAVARSEEQQAELAHLKLVPAREGGGIYPFAVEVSAVERADIVGPIGALVVAHLGMAARNGDVIKKNIAFGVTADRDDCGVLRSQDEAGAGVGPRVTTRTAPPGGTPWSRSLGSSRKGSDDPSPGNITTAGNAEVWCSGASGSTAVPGRSMGAPQEEQKLAPTGLRCPQRLQYNVSGLE